MSDFSASDVDSGYANGYVEDPNYDPYDLSRREQPNAVNGSSGRLSRAERDREEVRAFSLSVSRLLKDALLIL